jgi:hypothetical protein
VRYPVDTLVLPFLVRVDYQDITRDGEGVDVPFVYDYKHKTQGLQIEVGGGLDKELNKDSRVAAGIYYNYLMNKDLLSWSETVPGVYSNTEDDIAPHSTEHRVCVRLAGEHALSPTIALRAGVNLFYGWAMWEAEESDIYTDFVITDTSFAEFSADGSHWGIGASVGATVRFQRFTLEPFVAGGYQDLRLDGDGVDLSGTTLDTTYEGKFDQSMWYIGGGLSILFGL